MMKNLRRQEKGQVAILMVMILPVVFLLLALPLDAGIWYLDHTLAQHQADAAAFNPNASFGEGTVYFASAHVDLNPNNDVTLQIIAETIKVNNNGTMIARWDGDAFVKAPTARIALTG